MLSSRPWAWGPPVNYEKVGRASRPPVDKPGAALRVTENGLNRRLIFPVIL